MHPHFVGPNLHWDFVADCVEDFAAELAVEFVGGFVEGFAVEFAAAHAAAPMPDLHFAGNNQWGPPGQQPTV